MDEEYYFDKAIIKEYMDGLNPISSEQQENYNKVRANFSSV